MGGENMGRLKPETVVAVRPAKGSRAAFWRAAAKKAAKTARWSITMTKVLIRKLNIGTSWNLVTFYGEKGGESAGIVDLIAIRKDHRTERIGLKRGDLFEMIFIQVKGGTATWPTADDVKRLRIVGARYDAKAVILAEWKKGKEAVLYRLGGDDQWAILEDPAELFR
jgi:hypothetical protein